MITMDGKIRISNKIKWIPFYIGHDWRITRNYVSVVPFIVGSEQSSTPLLSPPIQPAGSSSSTGRVTIRSLTPTKVSSDVLIYTNLIWNRCFFSLLHHGSIGFIPKIIIIKCDKISLV